ncbi:hypothetical protein [Georgenia sp. H159]|uniref:COG4315 family predicted lipoprotein n=1 Tax=Georgenia sp. H159 TaxID=3076115 RepID=UPI002D78CB79|nr:hypothetical protein [Georgenia sp. H159]
MGRRTRGILATCIIGAGLLGACGDDDPVVDEPGGADAPSTTEEPMTGEEPMAGGTEIATADTDLGTVLVDGEGMTLYLFTNDSPGMSACTGDCLVAWPPVEGEPAAGEGVDEALLGSIEREDGTVQATYGDWPLYYFSQDTSPGDVTGQGVNDVWFVVTPDGEMVTEAPDSGAMGY